MSKMPMPKLEPLMFDDIEFNIKQYAIQGKMVVGKFTLSLGQSLQNSDAQINHRIKEELAKSMAIYLLENNLAEFTMREDHLNMAKEYRVRCYLTPDEQVRLIRSLYDKPI